MEKWSEKEVRARKAALGVLKDELNTLKDIHKLELEKIKRTEELIEGRRQKIQSEVAELREQGWGFVDGMWVELK